MKLNELKSHLIPTCKGKGEYIEALQTFVDRYTGLSENNVRHCMEYKDLNISDMLMDSQIDCCNCPFNGDDSWCCNDRIELPSDITAEEFNTQFLDILKTALAICKGEDRPTVLPPIHSPSDLVGLHSTDGKFRIDKDSSGFGNNGYEVVGALSSYPYYQFQELNFDVEQILGELGFQFTIQERKSYIEMLDECEEVEFKERTENYHLVENRVHTQVRYESCRCEFRYGVKYISKEDAERIVKECKENN